MKKIHAFTLIEILISVLLVWLLVWVLFRTYITISEVSFRVEQQKNINQEVFLLSQSMQNFANRNKIDYEKYSDLFNSSWIADVLYLSGQDWRFSIYSTWICDLFGDEELSCKLVLQKSWNVIELVGNSINLKNVFFKVLPYYDWDFSNCKYNNIACVSDQWFWFFTDFYVKWYDENKRTNNVSLSVQQFFNVLWN